MSAQKKWSALFGEKKTESAHNESKNEDKEIVQRQLEELREKIKDPKVAKKVALIISLWK